MKATSVGERYSWPKTTITDFKTATEKRMYAVDDTVVANIHFRIVGGLRESFIPDVWTAAWEENDKLVRLTINTSLSALKGRVLSKRLTTTGKEVRRAKFYWSRDPDLPYRIWSAIVMEDGSAPLIPLSVEDAKAKFLDVNKRLELPAERIGRGRHIIAGSAAISWGRRSYIAKGSASSKSKGVEVLVE